MTTRFADHFLKGTHAARPDAGSVPQGTKYVCSDHALIYETLDNATWETWASLAGGATSAALQAHLDDTSDAHDASAISFAPTGSVTATDVQAAIAEVDGRIITVPNGATTVPAGTPAGTIVIEQGA